MADIILMADGRREALYSDRDFADLVGHYMGSDAKEWLIGYLMDIGTQRDEAEQEAEWLKSHYRDVFRELAGMTWSLKSATDPEEPELERAGSIAGDLEIAVQEELERG